MSDDSDELNTLVQPSARVRMTMRAGVYNSTDELPEYVWVAILDEKSAYLGRERIGADIAVAERRVIVADVIDLPNDGSYMWSESRRAFVPRGYEFKSERSPVDRDFALYSVIQSMVGASMPVGMEALSWANWYRTTQLGRAQERMAFMTQRKNPRG